VECASVSLSPSLSISPSISLRLTNPRVYRASLSPLTVRFHLSLSLSFSCYSASIDSGMDHLIHPICIPLMLPVGRGMSAPTRRARSVPDLRYRLSPFPFIGHPPDEFPQRRSPLILHGKVYLIRARCIFGAFRFRRLKELE